MAFSLTDYKKKKSEEEQTPSKGFSLSEYHSGPKAEPVENTDDKLNQWFGRYNSLIEDYNNFGSANKTNGWANKTVSEIEKLNSQAEELSSYYKSHAMDTDTKYGKGSVNDILKEIAMAQSGLDGMLEGTISYRQANNPNREQKVEKAIAKIQSDAMTDNLFKLQRGNIAAAPFGNARDARYMNQLDLDIAGVDLDKEISAKEDELNLSRNKKTQAARSKDKSYIDDSEELQGELDALKERRSEIKNEQNSRAYESYMSRSKMPDFAEKSGYVSTQLKDVVPNLMTGQYADDIYGDLTYELVNKNPEARLVYDTNSSARGDYLFNGESNLTELTDEEIGVYNYLYNTDREKADEFLGFLNSSLNARQRERITNEYEKFAEDNPVLASAWSVASSPMKAVSALGQALDYGINGTIDENAAYNRFSYENSAIRNKVSQDIMERNVDDSGLTNFWGKAGSFLYQTGMSMGDFMYNAAITGAFGNVYSMTPEIAENMSLAIMGSGAGADATISAKDRGLSDSQAFAIGTVAGVAEIVTEKVSLDRLLDAAARGKGAIMYMISNTLAEGSEEVASDLINWCADIIIAQDKSEWEQSIKAYMNGGCTSRKEAFNQALKDKLIEMGMSFVGGALSGAAMSAGSIALNNIVTAYDIQKNGEQGQLIDSMLSERPNSVAFKTAANMNPGDMTYMDTLKSVAASDLTEGTESLKASNALKKAQREINQKGWVSDATLDAALNGTNVLEDYDINPEDSQDAKRSQLETALKAFAKGVESDSSSKGQIYQSANNNTENERNRQESNFDTVKKFSDNLGNAGRNALQNDFDSFVSDEAVMPYIEEATGYYNQGNQGAEFVYKPSDNVSVEVAKDMYQAGVEDSDQQIAKEGIEYESTGDSEKRTSDMGRRKGSSEVSGKSKSAYRLQSSTAESRRANVVAEKKVSTKEIGVASGTDSKQVSVIPYRLYDKELVRVSRIAKKYGVKVTFVVGEMNVQDGDVVRRIRGVHQTGEIIVRADHERLSATSIALHELYHELEDRSGGSLSETMRRKIIKHYSEAQLEELVTAYAEAYSWSNKSDEEILSEIFADAFAGIDIFDYLTTYQGATRFAKSDIQEWAREVDKDTNQMNAPPSVSFSEDVETNLAKDRAELERQIAELQKLVKARTQQRDSARGQLKLTPKDEWDKAESSKVAKDFAKALSSKTDVTKEVHELGRLILSGKAEDNAKIRDMATDIATKVVENAEELVSKDLDMYKQVRSMAKKGVSISDKDAHNIPDFNLWRKSKMGSITISKDGQSVDGLYDELNSIYGEMFPSDIAQASARLEHIVGVIEELRPVYENPYDYDMASAIEYAANDLLSRVVQSGLNPPAQTFADKAQAKLEKAVGEANEKAARKQQQLEKANAQNEERIANLKRTLEEVRRKRDENIAELKHHYKEISVNKAWREADSSARKKLLNIAKRLSNKKMTRLNRAALNEILGDLDTFAVNLTGKKKLQLAELGQWYESYIASNPDALRNEGLEKELDRLSKKQISELSYEEVLSLTKVLLGFENMIRTQGKLIDSSDRREVHAMAKETAINVELTAGKKGKAYEWWLTESLSPMRLFNRVVGYVKGDPMYKAAEALEVGQAKGQDYTRRANLAFKPWLENSEFIESIRGKKAKTVTITGVRNGEATNVEITRDMLMALYMHSLNEDNLRHISEGGITVPNLKALSKGDMEKAWSDTTRIAMTPSQVRGLASKLTAEERKFCNAAWIYFNTTSKDAINETSEKLLGYSLADVENYFPINTDRNFIKSEIPALKLDGTIEGMGFLKERNRASNPIYLRGLSDVLTKSIDQHAKYYGLAIPVRNFNKLWTATYSVYETDSNGKHKKIPGSSWGVRETIEKKWGTDTTKYIDKLLTDLQSPRKATDESRLLNIARGNYAGGVLSMNASVAIKQAASYPTAAAVLGHKVLVKALADWKKVDLDLIAKYTPLQWYRSIGYSTTELGDLAKGKGLPTWLNWIQAADLATTRQLWKASELYIQENNPELEIGSESYYNAVAHIYDRVILETQPNYTTMERPEVLRTSNPLIRNTIAMFKTQPLQNFNIVYDAFGNLQAKKKAMNNIDLLGEADQKKLKAEYAQAKKDAVNAVTSQIVQLAVFSAMTALWAFARGKTDKYEDEDGDVSFLSFGRQFGLDMVNGTLSSLLIGGDVYKFVSSMVTGKTYDGIEAISIQAISDALKNIVAIRQAFDEEYDSTEKVIDASYDSAMSIATLLGIPANNVSNLFKAMGYWVARTQGKYIGQYYVKHFDKTQYTYDSQYYNNLWEAYNHREKGEYEELLKIMIEDGFPEEKIRQEMNKRIKEKAGVASVKDLGADRYAGTGEESYNAMISALESSSNWNNVDEKIQDKISGIAYDIAVESNTGNKYKEKYSSQVDDIQYVLFRLALDAYDDGNGSYTNEEVEKALKSIYGSKKNKDAAFLYEMQTDSKNNPFK